MKHTSGAVLWFLVRFMRQGLAIVIVNVGEASNQIRAVMFLMVLSMYCALLTAVAPYDEFFRNHDGSAGAAKETGPRYKHLELVLVLGQALTVSLQFCSDIDSKIDPAVRSSKAEDVRVLLTALVGVVNVTMLLCLIYHFVRDKMTESDVKNKMRTARL